MPDFDATLTAGVEAGGYRTGATSADPWYQYVAVKKDRIETFRGRACSFRQLGIAGTTGQKLMTIFNATGSGIIVDVELIAIDVAQTAARVVEPPVIRGHKITTLPTGGTAITKTGVDSTMTSSSSVTLLQGTASEGGTATAITATAGSIVNQEVAPRALTLVGYEQFDRVEWFDRTAWTIRPGEGLLVNLDYSVATANPITDKWITTCQWSEYTRP